MPRKRNRKPKGKGLAQGQEQQLLPPFVDRQEQQQPPLPGFSQDQHYPPIPVGGVPEHSKKILQPPQAAEQGWRNEVLQPQDIKLEATKGKVPVSAVEAVSSRLERSVQLSSPLASRPGYGIRGRSIGLIVNYFPVELPHGYVYHYDVKVIPERRDTAGAKPYEKKYHCLSTKRNREVISVMLEELDEFRGHKPAYDGQKNLYTKRPIKAIDHLIKTLTLRVELDDEPRCSGYIVSIKPVYKKKTKSCAISLDPLHAFFAGNINEVPQEAVMAVETILRNGPCFRYVPLGRSFFYPPKSQDEMHPLSGGREIWYGYHQSLRLGEWKPMVNINITATTFYQPGPVINYISEILGIYVNDLFRTPFLKDMQILILTKELRDLRIKVNHLKYARKYRVLKVTREAANRLDFPIEKDGITIRKTVSDYFQETYNKKLKYPQLPCLQVGPESKKVFFPLEVCDIIEGQHCRTKMTDTQTSEMIKITACPSTERFNEIRDIVKRTDFNNDVYNREFGVRVSPDPLRIDGRVIEPPNVRYDNNTRVMPRDGSWDMRDKQFFRGAEINSWVLLSYASDRFCNREALNNFSHMLCSIGRDSGISLNSPAIIEIFGDGRNVKVDATLTRIQSKYRDVKLAVIVLPDGNPTVYGKVKQAAETDLGLVTQCVKAFNVVRKCNRPLVSNLCQKINAKMGGVNNSLTPGEIPEILRKPVIIIGVSTSHPPPGSGIEPWIAAAVGSLDAHPSRYTSRVQKYADEKNKASEIILDLKHMVIELLKAFYRNTNGKKPEKIIFYRGSIGESQFAHVLDHELKAVRDACHSLNADYEPGITFVVVQKRHRTRFMPHDPRDRVGKMGNIPPGTTVDRKVTSRINFDFLLCSHFANQGTSRPRRYIVLSDDNYFTSDDMQKLTYYLCHTYARCTKSISVPAPIAYANLVAHRARQHLISQLCESSASSLTSSASSLTFGGTIRDFASSWKDAIEIKPNLKDAMYFV